MCEDSQHTKYVARFQEESLLNLGVLHTTGPRDTWDSATSALPKWRSAHLRTLSRLFPFPSLSRSRAPSFASAESESGKWRPARGPPTTKCSRILKVGRLWEGAGHSLACPGSGTKKVLLGMPMRALLWAAVPMAQVLHILCLQRSAFPGLRGSARETALHGIQDSSLCRCSCSAAPMGAGVGDVGSGAAEWKGGGPRCRARLLSPSRPSWPPTQAC